MKKKETSKRLFAFQLILVTCLVTISSSSSSNNTESHRHEYHRGEHKQKHGPSRYVSMEVDEDRQLDGPEPYVQAFMRSPPGLYEADYVIRPLRGHVEFEKYVIYGDSTNMSSSEKLEPKNQYISMVQYYMATCPDCQGFSPYFKRFVSDVGVHWRPIVRVFVVNCNDEANIQLCWDQNPTLLVPLVRWYAFPIILRNALSGSSESGFPREFLNVSHRQFIEGERRDHISLRRATLRYLNTVMYHLSGQTTTIERTGRFDQELIANLPIRWHIHRSLDMGENEKNSSLFQDTLRLRSQKCVDEADLDSFQQVAHFILVSDQKTRPISRTVIADWSNWTCLPGVEPAVLIHHVNDPTYIDFVFSETGDELLFDQNRFKEEGQSLFSFKVNNITSEKLKFTFLISRKMILRDKKGRHNHDPRRSKRSRPVNGGPIIAGDESSKRRMSLEQYYNRRKSLGSSQRYPYKYAASRDPPIGEFVQLKRARRSVVDSRNKTISETINYAPPELYRDEELIRYRFNEAIYRLLHDKYNLTTVHAGFENENFGRINNSIMIDPNKIVPPAEEDLKRLTLTDYYKVLDEIVHKNIISRADTDGYQMMTNICLLETLIEYFPFQGSDIKKSKSRFFLELVRNAYIKALNDRIDGKFKGCKETLSNFDENLSEKLSKLKFKSKDLAEVQSDQSREHDVGLPSENYFKWSYCAGSSDYLRGHTCSLWVLFHSLTVREYQKEVSKAGSVAVVEQNQPMKPNDDKSLIEYKFKVKYSPENSYCDPNNPDPALLNSTTEQLYVRAPRFAITNVINFVRFYLSCTNCAAHFSCMVHNSDINFKDPEPADHLLWLWEAHNRVNVRTRKTHSEDPIHPKHVFPDYGACPHCYIEKPTNSTDFTSMRFNRLKLIEFIVARYQKSAILSNKIRIEDLFYKQKPVLRSKS